MTKLVVDAATQAKLNHLDDILEVCDEAGRTLGYFHPALRLFSAGTRNLSERRA